MASIVIKSEPKETQDILQTCRLCLSEESTECVLVEQNLRQWISNYLSIEIFAEDGLSQKVCIICRILLTEFHQFRERCQEVQSTLQSMIHTEKPAIETDLDVYKWNVENELASENLYQKSVDIQENDTQKILTEIDEQNSSQANSKIYEQSIHIDGENGETLTNGQNVVIEDTTDIKEVVNNESENDRKSPVKSTHDPPTTNGKQKIQCTICNAVFSKRQQLYYHRTSQHGVIYVCPICKKPFRNRYVLKRHMVVHADQTLRPFKCDVCEKAFKANIDLSVHKKLVHGPKIHKCSICGCGFSRGPSLIRHMQRGIHNGEPTNFPFVKRNETGVEQVFGVLLNRTKRQAKVIDFIRPTTSDNSTLNKA